jgi:hypothetical protein
VNSIDRAQIAKEANDNLKQAEEKLDAALQGVDASAVFGSYAMFRLARWHAGEDHGPSRPTPAAIELAAWLLFPHFDKRGSFVENEKIKMSLKPTELRRDPKLASSNKKFLKYPRVHQAAFLW